jgi:hypothetical protein
MKNHSECEFIRERIEEQILRRSESDTELINSHLEFCDNCKAYGAELRTLYAASARRYSLPQYERMNFSAMVRTRIEDRKFRKQHRGYISRPVFQIAAMILIAFAVTFYMMRTEPEPFLVFDDDVMQMLDTYTYFSGDILIPDEALIADLYIGTLLDSDVYDDDIWYRSYIDDEYLFDIDDLTPEEINYIIQRLEEV